ncbi:hypothetical protein SAMN05421688_2853 [Poseidonocella pacifica]|uniref:Uncharacterized protein n=1 Tax=Poseidonocella pacifica TaxID=871651 RepID=A0A1I0YAD6_9RHOB|nr:hypothetical protein [Poseidonocella pacifica]SFB10254.1 hypothetical protein SAMN05421688_2853 [Poseidonocella pacifica]
MTALPPKTLVEHQVDLVRVVIERRAGMPRHLTERVMPHLGAGARAMVRETIEHLDDETDIDEALADYLDIAIVEIRGEIAAGTTEEKIQIPPERLIGCTEAFDRHRRLSQAAEALQEALPPLVELYHAVRRAIDFAEAIKMSIHMINPD